MSDTNFQSAFERRLVHHCTPTLAALKPANLFTYPDKARSRDKGEHMLADDEEQRDSQLLDAVKICREKLIPHGVRIELLARRKTGTLVYVYRPSLVKRALDNHDIAAYLIDLGYDPTSLSSCIETLHHRICGTDWRTQLLGQCEFPHEIGFFLGYPYDDVIGFIENDGEGFLCSGCWKVYSKSRDAEACFCCYKNCTVMYENLFDEGVSIDCLAAVDEDFPASEAFRAVG